MEKRMMCSGCSEAFLWLTVERLCCSQGLMASGGCCENIFINKIHLNCSQVEGDWIEHTGIPNIDYIKPFSLENAQ